LKHLAQKFFDPLYKRVDDRHPQEQGLKLGREEIPPRRPASSTTVIHKNKD